MSGRLRGYIAKAFLALCLLLGGASAAGAIANAVLQVLAILVILALLWSRRLVVPPEARMLVVLVGLFVLTVLASLIPLPWSVWQNLPYRSEVAEGLRMVGVGEPSLPLSLAPAATISSLLWLLPPAAMFLIAVTLAPDQRRRLCGTILILAVLSVMLGVAQLIGGTGSPLRFYEITNEGKPVGFFSNVNHNVTLMLCALPCAAVLAAQFRTRQDQAKRRGGLIMSIAFGLFLTAGIALAGSLAGYGLLLPAALAALLVYLRGTSGPVGTKWKAAMAILLVLAAGLALTSPVAEQSISNKIGEKPDSRREFAARTTEVIVRSLPVGTGLGTFAAVYRRHENHKMATTEYLNHAHNDYLEAMLELGLPAALLILGFFIWWVRRFAWAWSTDISGANLARVASVIIGIILLHSLVEYPIRTSALAAVFATACALLIPYSGSPQRRKADDQPSPTSGVKHLEAV